MVKIIVEKFIDNNDIYLIIAIGKYIITNNSYQGLFIFNSDLEMVKDINLGNISCQSFYKSFDDKELLIFSDKDDIKKLFLINLENFTTKEKIIEGPLYLSKFYFWDKDKVILIDPSEDHYYCFDITTFNFYKINKEHQNNKYDKFFQFYKHSKNFNVMQVYSDNMAFSFFDYSNNHAGLFQLDKIIKTEKINYDPESLFDTPHDVIFYDGCFIIIAQNYLLLKKDDLRDKINSDGKFLFSRASFLKNNTNFVALLNDKFIKLENKLIRYCFSKL